MEVSRNNPPHALPLSRVEAVVTSMDENSAELQIAGSYETFRWPRKEIRPDIAVGQKILLELKNHPLTGIQKTVENARQENKDPVQQIKLLESLIN